MTKQEIFDKVAAHLLTQNKRSIGGEQGLCSYRGDDGLKCAVGCLIADEAYHPRLEGGTCDRADVQAALEKSGVQVQLNRVTQDMLYDLQGIHDGSFPPAWKAELKALAYIYQLNADVLGV